MFTKILKEEENYGIKKFETYEKFGKQVEYIRLKVKENFKKLNIDIHKNKRYLLTPLESAKKFVKLI